MRCLMCKKDVDHYIIEDNKDAQEITIRASCHGDREYQTFTYHRLNAMASTGRDVDHLPFFATGKKPVYLEHTPKDPEGVTTLKNSMKELLKTRRPGWFRGEGGFSSLVLQTVTKALDGEDALPGVRADLNQLIGIAELSVEELLNTPGISVHRKAQLELRMKLIQTIKGTKK